MAVAITVNQVGTQNRVDLQLDLGDAAGQVSAENQVETTAALLGFMDESARTDEDLPEDQARLIRLKGNAGNQHKKAEMVGRRIQCIADEFIAQFRRDPQMNAIVDECTVDTDGNPSPQSASQHFFEVVKTVFECDENGVATRINLGRIAGVFAYCYYLCKTFIQRHAMKGIFGFLGVLLGFLVQSLVKTRFYEWLSVQGGWGQLLALTDRLLPRLPLSRNILLGSAVVLFVMWAISYWRS